MYILLHFLAFTILRRVHGSRSSTCDEEFPQFCTMLDELAFLPIDEVPERMEHLKDFSQPEAAELLTFLDNVYFTKTNILTCVVHLSFTHRTFGIYMKQRLIPSAKARITDFLAWSENTIPLCAKQSCCSRWKIQLFKLFQQDGVSGQKVISEFLQGVGHNIRVNKNH